MELNKVLEALTPEIVEKFKLAIELGKWPDGKRLTPEQLEICMQAVIAYEHKFVEETARTGYVPPKDACASESQPEESPLTWQK
ncbi:hypothetical protein TDB9533_01302 [Thalassocella blandensis]|nr:hypothetical protein TDB9533_01302 [Thalassocella blandensis]